MKYLIKKLEFKTLLNHFTTPQTNLFKETDNYI
jgi:hypothetical protein